MVNPFLVMLKKTVPRPSPLKNNQPKRTHFYYHCDFFGDTCPNCFKWLVSQKKTSVSNPQDQSKAQNSMPLHGELIKALSLLTQF